MAEENTEGDVEENTDTNAAIDENEGSAPQVGDSAKASDADKSAEQNYMSEFADSAAALAQTSQTLDKSVNSLSQFAGAAASLTQTSKTLGESVNSLNAQKLNLESIMRITNNSLKKQRVYTVFSLVIILVGILISTTAVVISASTIGSFSNQFGAISESLMVRLNELETGVEYLESNRDTLTTLQNGFSELLLESREGLQQMSGALQVNASTQAESSSQLATTILEANQYDYQSLVGLNETIQTINERIVSLENQLRANEGQVEELAIAAESIDELNSVLQALVVLEQENYLEVLQELLAISEPQEEVIQQVQFFRDSPTRVDQENIQPEIEILSEALGLDTEEELIEAVEDN